MNIRLDKVIRRMGLGFHKAYSLVLTDRALYLIQTGSAGTLKHYHYDQQLKRVVTERSDRSDVQKLEASEARLTASPLDNLVRESNNFLVRLEAIEDVIVRPTNWPELIVKVTGSDHRLVFPLTPLDQVQTFARALKNWNQQSN
jgi:autonomous glycyl radical cofactor GrcA